MLRGSRRCRTQLRTEGTQHVPGINARVVTVTPIDMQGIVAHCTQADGVDVLSGDRGHHLEGIGWRLLLLAPQLATGGTWASLTQVAIGIEALVPIIPEDAHLTLIVPLDLHRVECLTGVSHKDPHPHPLPGGEGRGCTSALGALYRRAAEAA